MFGNDDLTPRQREVIELIARGHTNGEIATRLGISIDGVKWHVSEVLSKLGVATREEAADLWRHRPAAQPRPSVVGLAIAATAGVAAIAVILVVRTGFFSGGSEPADPELPVAGRVAFVRDGDIWLAELEGREERLLHESGEAHSPRISPSGRYVAFIEEERLQVVDRGGDVVVAAGLTGLKVTKAEWSPTDDILAVGTESGLWLWRVRNASPEHISVPGDDYGLPLRDLVWRPDGRQIAFFRGIREGLIFRDVPESQPRPGETPSESFRYQLPAGQSLAGLASWSDSQACVLAWVLPGDTVSASVLADGAPFGELCIGRGFDEWATTLVYDDWVSSVDGQVAFVGGGDRRAWKDKLLVLTNPDGERTEFVGDELASGVAVQPGGGAVAASTGPAVMGDDSEHHLAGRRITVFPQDGLPFRITSDEAYREEFPRWSPDGESLTFIRIRSTGGVSLWGASPGAGNAAELVAGIDVPSPEEGLFGYYGHVEWSRSYHWLPASN